jgi:hypothetical protein
MKLHRVLIVCAGFCALAACTPESARQARGDLHLTAGAAASASRTAASEAAMMGPIADDIRIDVNNIKEVEAWFDSGRRISFD